MSLPALRSARSFNSASGFAQKPHTDGFLASTTSELAARGIWVGVRGLSQALGYRGLCRSLLVRSQAFCCLSVACGVNDRRKKDCRSVKSSKALRQSSAAGGKGKSARQPQSEAFIFLP